MSQILGETGDGIVEFDTNEMTIRSKVEDPPKLRLATAAGVGSGALSFNRFIDGVQRENVLLQGKQDERVREDPRNAAGELTLHLSNGTSYEDPAMVRVLEVRHDTLEFFGRAKFTAEDFEALLALARKGR